MLRFYITSVSFLILTVFLLVEGRPGLSMLSVLLCIIIIIYGVASIQSSFFSKAVCKFQTNKPRIALTFDDGPDAKTNEILDILKENDLRASFFCIGSKMKNNPETVKRIHNEGHTIANHSYNHSNRFPWFSVKHIEKELSETQNVLFETTGVNNQYFRPPYGVLNPNIVRAVRRLNLKIIGWNVRSYDTSIKSKEKVLKRITRKLKKGDIVLLHDTSKDIIWILKELVQFLRRNNLTSVNIDTLISQS